MNDRQVTWLYRCLLGRDPESERVVRDFVRDFQDFDDGRAVLLRSDEFAAEFARLTGFEIARGAGAATKLARAFLTDGQVRYAVPGLAAAPDPVLREGMEAMLSALGTPRLAVVLGATNTARLGDLVPFDDPESAVIHVAEAFPPGMPVLETDDGRRRIFRLSTTGAALARVLAAAALKVDVLHLLGRPADTSWIAALAPALAEKAVILIGPPQPGFAPAELFSLLGAVLPCEMLAWHGRTVVFVRGWHLPLRYLPPETPIALPDRAAYPALALAAIVRNEAASVVNMLESARPVASFYAVLDTGSEDATPDLVRDFLARSGVPHAFAVHRDADRFDLMRNAALDLVPEGIAWTLMLDADEEIVPEDAAPLLQLIRDTEADAFLLPRYNFPGADKAGLLDLYPDRQGRLIRNRPHAPIRYTGAVHETLAAHTAAVPLDASPLGLPRGGPHIHHLVRRFKDAEAEAKKQEFYRTIARKYAAPP